MRSNRSKTTHHNRINFEAIGTYWEIETAIPISPELLTIIEQRIESFDKTYSRFRPDSLVAKVTRQAGTYEFPKDVLPLISLYRTLYEISDSKVTPLIGHALENAGYDARYSFTEQKITEVAKWDDCMYWNESTLTTDTPVVIDFGAAGKGYLIDIISELLLDNKHRDFVIDASGDIRHVGLSENIVGLEHPLDSTKIIGALSIQNTSLCASATNRRAWGNGMHHIIDPTTLRPVQDIIATWVVTNDTMTADGLATALFFTEPAKLRQAYEFEYIRMHANNTVDYSSLLSGELYI